MPGESPIPFIAGLTLSYKVVHEDLCQECLSYFQGDMIKHLMRVLNSLGRNALRTLFNLVFTLRDSD